MPIEIKDLDGGRGNLIVGKEVLTGEEYVRALEDHLTGDKEKFKKYRYSLSDYTAVTEVEIPSGDIELMAEMCMKAAAVNPDAVVALITDDDLLYGLSRMWEILIDNTSWETMVFRNRKDAFAWVEKRVKEKHGIDDLTFE